MDISVVVPVYGCPQAVEPLAERLIAAIEPITPSFEIILVNDACPKGSWAEIKKVCEKEKRVIGLNLAKNVGQENAIVAGLDYAVGEWIVVMDCDLQNRPEDIPALYAKAQEGYDVVFAKRQERKDSWLTKTLSWAFYKVYNYFADDCYDPDVCNFSIVHRKVINAYLQTRERRRSYTMLISWLGFRQTAIPLLGDSRYAEKSSYTFGKKIKLAIDTILSQSNKPLRFSVGIGFTMTAISFVYILYLVIRTLMYGTPLEGWTSLMASLFLIGGLLMMSIGVAGLYIGNIFDEVKSRPLYNAMETLNGRGDAV